MKTNSPPLHTSVALLDDSSRSRSNRRPTPSRPLAFDYIARRNPVTRNAHAHCIRAGRSRSCYRMPDGIPSSLIIASSQHASSEPGRMGTVANIRA